MAEKIITKQYTIKNPDIYKPDELTDLEEKGFFYIDSDYQSFCCSWRSSVFHYKAGTTLKVKETKNAIVTLGGEVKELNTFFRI